MITSGSGLLLNFKCPYQAKVMKTFEQNSIRIGNTDGGIVKGMDELSGMGRRNEATANRGARTGFPEPIAFDFKSRQTDSNPVAAVNAGD
jgi:hypothetical protein